MSDEHRPAPDAIASATPESTEATEPATDRIHRRWSLESIITASVIGVLAALVAIRLGASLLGLEVFAGADLLTARAPWNDGGTKITTLNGLVGDTMDTFAPGYIESHQRFWSGDVPLWSGYSASGSPLLASTNLGLLTPISGWLIVFPVGWALGLVKLLQLVVAFCGMLWWLRRIGVATWAAAAAGLLYCGTGFFVGWSNWIPQTTTAALIPALFWAVERFVQERRVTAALPIALVTAFLLFGGFPATAGHALYAAGGYFIVRLIADRTHWAVDLRAFAVGAGAVVLGVGLAAVQLVGLIGQLSETDLSYRGNQFYGDLSFRSFLSTVLPRAFTVDGYPASNAIESFAYLGAGTVLLAVIGVLLGRYGGLRRGVVGFLVGATVVASAIAWWQGWWTDWLADIPILADNAAGRLRDVVGVFMAALAGIGAHTLLRPAGDRRVALVKSWVTIGLGVLGVITLAGLYLHYRGQVPDPSDLFWDVLLGSVTVVAIVVAAWTWRRHVVAVAAMSLAVIVAGTQIIVNTAFYWPTADPDEFFPENGLIAAAQNSVVHDRAILMSSFFGSTAQAYGLRTVTGHTFQPEPWRDILESIDPEAYSAPGRTATNPGLGVGLENGMLDSALFDRLGARWVISAPGKAIPGKPRSPDGTSDPKVEPTGATPLLPGQKMSVEATSGPLRAVQVRVAAKVPADRQTRLDVRVLATDGTELASGAISTRGVNSWVSVPVAAETLPENGGSVTIEVTNHGTELSLATADDQPVLRLLTPLQDGLRLTYSDTHGTLWERLDSLSRIRWAADTEVIADPSARLDRLAEHSLPDQTVVLNTAGPRADGKPAEITVIADTGDRIVVDVAAEGAGYLVVADSMDADWTVTIDGRPTELVAADHAFAGVVLPAGDHQVEFRYDGYAAGIGTAVTAGSALVFVAVLGLGWYRRRRSSKPAISPAAGTAVASS